MPTAKTPFDATQFRIRRPELVVPDQGPVDTGIDEGAIAAVADLVVSNIGTIRLHAEPDAVIRDVILSDGDVRLVVHADADEEQRGRLDRVAGHEGAGRANSEDAVECPVRDSVLSHFSIFSTDDSDVEAVEAANIEPLNPDVLDVRPHGGNLAVFRLEGGELNPCSDDANARGCAITCQPDTSVRGSRRHGRG